jgi:hypothetical protein
MPWGWGKKPAAVPAVTEASPSPSLPGESPPPTDTAPLFDSALAGEVRFRVDTVLTIVGQGCVVSGEVEAGVLRVPGTLRLLTAEPRPDAPATVQVVLAYAHHKPITEIPSGTSAGLTLRGVTGERPNPLSRQRHWPGKKGDHLVLP